MDKHVTSVTILQVGLSWAQESAVRGWSYGFPVHIYPAQPTHLDPTTWLYDIPSAQKAFTIPSRCGATIRGHQKQNWTCSWEMFTS